MSKAYPILCSALCAAILLAWSRDIHLSQASLVWRQWRDQISRYAGGQSEAASESSRVKGFEADAPEKSGYKLVFSDDFTDATRIDLKNTGRPGYNWYMNNFYWSSPTPSEAVSFGADGVTITANLSTATGTGRDKTKLVGQGWGGGAYFEAMLRFDPDKVVVEDGDWPAFYGLSWQLASKTDQAPRQPAGYQHFGEIDFMEYGFWNHRNRKAVRGYFWQIMHDWYGIKEKTCPGSSWCGISNNATTGLMPVDDIGGWHRYGARWVVGDSTHKSFVQAYYDGKAIGEPVYWPNYPSLDDVPTPPTDANAYSITDFTKFIIVLQANENAPMTVRYVKVWQ
jgi:hypothetical protein